MAVRLLSQDYRRAIGSLSARSEDEGCLRVVFHSPSHYTINTSGLEYSLLNNIKQKATLSSELDNTTGRSEFERFYSTGSFPSVPAYPYYISRLFLSFAQR